MHSKARKGKQNKTRLVVGRDKPKPRNSTSPRVKSKKGMSNFDSGVSLKAYGP